MLRGALFATATIYLLLVLLISSASPLLELLVSCHNERKVVRPSVRSLVCLYLCSQCRHEAFEWKTNREGCISKIGHKFQQVATFDHHLIVDVVAGGIIVVVGVVVIVAVERRSELMVCFSLSLSFFSSLLDKTNLHN